MISLSNKKIDDSYMIITQFLGKYLLKRKIFFEKKNNRREKSLRIKISGMNYFDLVSI